MVFYFDITRQDKTLTFIFGENGEKKFKVQCGPVCGFKMNTTLPTIIYGNDMIIRLSDTIIILDLTSIDGRRFKKGFVLMPGEGTEIFKKIRAPDIIKIQKNDINLFATKITLIDKYYDAWARVIAYDMIGELNTEYTDVSLDSLTDEELEKIDEELLRLKYSLDINYNICVQSIEKMNFYWTEPYIIITYDFPLISFKLDPSVPGMKEKMYETGIDPGLWLYRFQ